jgi:hypothetical protein
MWGEKIMNCKKCGYNNNHDVKFCEKCGSNLNKSALPASSKILIIAVIILVAGLGLASGMKLMNNLPNTILNNTTAANNNTPVNIPSNTTLTTSNNNTPTTSNVVKISPQEAMQIVDNTMSPYDKATDAVLENGTPNPVYVVNIIHTNGVANGTYGGYVTVDAVTGFCNHKGV